jgi:hypothetical protein
VVPGDLHLRRVDQGSDRSVADEREPLPRDHAEMRGVISADDAQNLEHLLLGD